MRRSGFPALLAGNGISMAGTSMSAIAVPWFVLSGSGSAMNAGIVAFAEMLPYVAMEALGGPLVDRVGPRRLSAAADLAAAIAMGAVALLSTAGALSFPALLGLMLLAGSCRGLGDTAKRVLIPQAAALASIPLERASGLYDGANRLAGLLGGAAGGLLIAATSAPAVILIDAASFAAASALIALGMKGAGDAPTRDTGRGAYRAKLAEGFGYLIGDRLLVSIGILLVASNLLDQAFFSVLLPLWAREELGSPIALSAFSAIFGIGAVAGNALLAWLGPRASRRRAFAIAFLICGSPRFFALALSTSYPFIACVALMSGLGAGGINPALGAVEFERIPQRLHARALGALGAISWAGIPLGGLVGGALASFAGARGALALCGFAYLLTTLSPFAFPIWREMERGRERHSASLDTP